MKFYIVFAFTLMSLGCATDSNETNFKEVKSKQRVYVGKVSVKLNGQPAEKCELFMNSKLSPNLKLSEDGYVVYKTSDRKPYIGKVRCLHKIDHRKLAWHTQKLYLKPLVRPKKRKSVNYFGHLELDWEIDADKTLKASSRGSYDRKKVGMVDDSGEIKLAVADKNTEAAEYIKATWAPIKDFRIETHLVVKEDADEDEELDQD